jgi:DNA-binding CsgD family transcriptional regulator
MKKLTAITLETFIRHFTVTTAVDMERQLEFYNGILARIKHTALAHYFWIISNNNAMKLEAVSDSVAQLTPFSKGEWLNSNTEFFMETFHPDDRCYVLAAFEHASALFINMDTDKRKQYSFNFYGRMLNHRHEYRWVLLQASTPFVNRSGQIESSLSIIYDLSGFRITNLPLLSVVDFNNKETTYYKYDDRQLKESIIQPVMITAREKEILLLMAQGLNTPQIAEKLFISYYTVENHKRNLRKKTNSKTSSELMAYVISHNLLLM